MNKNTPTPSKASTINLPDLKPINVGIPPVKNGFGLLKIGSTVIYKGMWVDGKFEGKGKLTWNGFAY